MNTTTKTEVFPEGGEVILTPGAYHSWLTSIGTPASSCESRTTRTGTKSLTGVA
jgi:hypothetical protein